MSNKLKNEVDEIFMSQAMKEIILQNILVKDKKKKRKKYILSRNSLEVTAACCTLLVCAVFIKAHPELLKYNNSEIQEESVGYDNYDFNNIEETEQYALEENIENKSDEDSKKSDDYNKKTSLNHKADLSSDQSKVQSNNNLDKYLEISDDSKSSDSLNETTPPTDKNDNFTNKDDDSLEEGTLQASDKIKNQPEDSADSDNVCGGSPIVDFKTVEDAEKVLNFKVSLIKDIDEDYKITNVTVLSGDNIPINYSN